jgi:CAAX prenyl protease-like protein
VRSIVESQPDLTSAALEIHCVIEGVDERVRTRSESIVAEVMRLARQVTNGGFDQYFFNSGVWSASRGSTQMPIEKRFGPVVTVAISTILFVLVHISHGVAPLLRKRSYYAAAGCVYGALAHRTRSIFPSLPLHPAWRVDWGWFGCGIAKPT